MVGRDGDRGRGCGHGRGRGRKGRPRLSTGHPLDLHADPYTLVGSSSGMTVATNRRPPPIATTTPSRQEPQIHMMPTPVEQDLVGKDKPHLMVPKILTVNELSLLLVTLAQVLPSLDMMVPSGFWHPLKPGLKRISQVFKENYKSWLNFDEADDDTQKIWWTEWRKCFDILDTEDDDIYQAWRFRAAKRLRDNYRAKNTSAKKLTRGTSIHTAGGTTFPEARLRLDIFQERMFQAKQKRQAVIKAGVTDPPPISEESIWIETVGGKRRGRVYGMGEVRDSSMVRPRVDGPTTTTNADVLDLRERITILNRKVEQHAANYRELEDRHQREKREWQQTVESLREDLNTGNSQMD
ncbi:uncharacterized protein DS421_11g335730 [Arachis hypogaea]|nr:uncharacterized protein DS421_11g335730 [Arachis hypogaea]